jgi:GNAT superfamily N-acetyltransferase
VNRPTIRPFAPDDLDAAGRLLAARHAALRRVEPLFDQRYEEPSVARAEVAALLDAGATGAVAVAQGEVTGYLLGAHREGAVWGANVWVEAAGHAVTEAETVRDLYAVAAADWVDRGWEVQCALVPAHDAALVDAWFRLGFGQQHVHAVRELPAPSGRITPGVTVRPPRAGDVPVLAELDLALPAHQLASPVFAGGEAFSLEEAAEEWTTSIEAAGADGLWHVVADVEGRVVGAATACSLDKSSGHAGLAGPPSAGFLGWASVLPDARGRGVGRALGEATLDWMHRTGFTCAVTDWRATNLLSSRAWPALGYRPTFLRLHRRVGY